MGGDEKETADGKDDRASVVVEAAAAEDGAPSLGLALSSSASRSCSFSFITSFKRSSSLCSRSSSPWGDSTGMAFSEADVMARKCCRCLGIPQDKTATPTVSTSVSETCATTVTRERFDWVRAV